MKPSIVKANGNRFGARAMSRVTSCAIALLLASCASEGTGSPNANGTGGSSGNVGSGGSTSSGGTGATSTDRAGDRRPADASCW